MNRSRLPLDIPRLVFLRSARRVVCFSAILYAYGVHVPFSGRLACFGSSDFRPCALISSRLLLWLPSWISFILPMDLVRSDRVPRLDSTHWLRLLLDRCPARPRHLVVFPAAGPMSDNSIHSPVAFVLRQLFELLGSTIRYYSGTPQRTNSGRDRDCSWLLVALPSRSTLGHDSGARSTARVPGFNFPLANF